MKKTDIGVVAVFYAVCIFFLVMTLQLPRAAQIYPLCIIGLIFFLTSLYVIKMIRGAVREGIVSGLDDFRDLLPGQLFAILAMIIVYLILMRFVGFYISSAVFMVGALLFLRVRKLFIAISTAVVICLVYFAFSRFLGVNLPTGIFFG